VRITSSVGVEPEFDEDGGRLPEGLSGISVPLVLPTPEGCFLPQLHPLTGDDSTIWAAKLGVLPVLRRHPHFWLGKLEAIDHLDPDLDLDHDHDLVPDPDSDPDPDLVPDPDLDPDSDLDPDPTEPTSMVAAVLTC
jgi:hypothetical protein